MERVKTALLFNDKYKQGYSYIMANPTTVAEWKQVAANAQAQIDAVNLQKTQGEAQITALEQQLLANGQKISDFITSQGNRYNPRDPVLVALEAETNAIKQNIDKTAVYVRSTLTSQLFQLRATINNANTQAGVATTGAPNTNTNTPPETVVPDQSNTAVTTEKIPPIENATPPFATGQNAATNAAFQDANASPQQLVDPNTDPNTNIGAEGQTGVRTSETQAGNNTETGNTGFKGDSPVQIVNPESGNQGGNNNNDIPPNAASQSNDDGIIDNNASSSNIQGGREDAPIGGV